MYCTVCMYSSVHKVCNRFKKQVLLKKFSVRRAISVHKKWNCTRKTVYSQDMNRWEQMAAHGSGTEVAHGFNQTGYKIKFHKRFHGIVAIHIHYPSLFTFLLSCFIC